MTDKELLEYVLKNTTVQDLNDALSKYNIQTIYERHEKRMVSEFFGGDVLKWSVQVSRAFKPYRCKNEVEGLRLSEELSRLREKIKRGKRYKVSNLPETIAEYNLKASRLNELNEPTHELIRVYRRLHKDL